MRWKELGRHVRKGEKAITLCMPVTCKAKHSKRDEQGNETEQEVPFTRFVYRNNWFVLTQTDGAEYKPEPLPDWEESQALATLAIERIPFDELNGNIQGYATGRKVAINPVAAMPNKTLFTLNQAFENVLADLQRLQRLPFFRLEFLREFQVMVEETRSCVNFELVEAIYSREQDDWTRYGRLRQQWEKRLQDPDDALI